VSWSEQRLTYLNRAQFRASHRSQITRLMKHVASRNVAFDFRRVVPVPPDMEVVRVRIMPEIDLEDMDILQAWARHVTTFSKSERFEAVRVTKWCKEQWGGPFAPRDIEARRDRSDPAQVTYLFHTAWGPPRGVHSELMRLFPHVHITWDYWNAQTKRWRLSIVSYKDVAASAPTVPPKGSRPVLSIVGSEEQK